MMNKTAAFQGTDNYKQIREEFVEKNGLSRSLHPALLAGDDEIQKCYRKACKNGELPVYQVKVHFVGDPYAGKTSTRRHLMGESFCEELARTEGIETNNVETCYADEDWNPITSMDADSEYRENLAWCVARETEKEKQKEEKSNNSPLIIKEELSLKTILDITTVNKPKMVIEFTVKGFVSILTLLLGTLHKLISKRFIFGTALIYWPLVILFCLQWKNFGNVTNAYRLGSALSVGVLIISVVDEFKTLGNLVFFLIYCLSSLMVLFIQSFGSRTGFVMAIFWAISKDQMENESEIGNKVFGVSFLLNEFKEAFLESFITYAISMPIGLAFSFWLLNDWYLCYAIVLLVLSISSK